MSETTNTEAAEVAEGSSTVAGESTADNTEGATTGEHVTGEDTLGDKGKKALDAMKAKWKEADRLAKERETELADLRAKAEGREAEHAAEQERRKVESDALAKANDRILKAEVRAAAAAKLADPADALRFLDLSQFEVGDDGDVDTSAVNAAIENLLTEKPYLAAQGGTSGQVFESPGAHRNGAITQVTRAEVERMSPDQINVARAEGRLNDLLGIKS